MPTETASMERKLRLAGSRRKRLLDQLNMVEGTLRKAVVEARPVLTHRRIAELAGVTHGTVQNWERAVEGGDN